MSNAIATRAANVTAPVNQPDHTAPMINGKWRVRSHAVPRGDGMDTFGALEAIYV